MIGAFVRIEIVDDFSYPASFLMSEFTILVPVVTSFFIGKLTVGSQNSDLFGTDYFTFAVVGLAITGVMQTALGGFGSSLQRAQERGTLETLLVEPVPWTVLPLVMNVWRTVLAAANGALVLFAGWLLGASYDPSGLPVFILLVLLGILASQAVGILSASFLVLAKKSQPIVKLYSLAASILAGAVFSIDQLPTWLRVFSFMIPHTYVVTTARSQLMEDAGSFAIPASIAIPVLIGFTAVVMTGGLLLFRRSLNYARKTGTLSGY